MPTQIRTQSNRKNGNKYTYARIFQQVQEVSKVDAHF